MSGWTPDLNTFTDLLQSDGALPAQDESSPMHRRSGNDSSPQPRALFSTSAPSSQPPTYPYPYGSYPYGQPPYAPPPYGLPPYAPPPYGPTGGDGQALPPYQPPPYAPPPYAPPPYAPLGGDGQPIPPYQRPPPSVPARPDSTGSENEGAGTNQPRRAKRLEWTTADEEKLVSAWILHSNDSIRGNSKSGATFWGSIADTFNSTTEPHRHRTSKQLKDHWVAYNREVVKFNGIYIQEERIRQSGADDAMVMECAMARYSNNGKNPPFKRHHWWQAVRYEPKWSGRQSGSGSDVSSTKRTRLGPSGEYSSGDTEEEVARPMGRDRAKAAARKEKEKAKGKGTASSSSESKASKAFGMKHLFKGLVTAKLMKQWNKLKDRNTENMDQTEKRIHMKALKMVETNLGLIDETGTPEEEEEEEEEEDEIENSD